MRFRFDSFSIKLNKYRHKTRNPAYAGFNIFFINLGLNA